MMLADITGLLKTIRTAVYGRDMRGAIHDSLEKLSDGLNTETSDRKLADKTLQGNIDAEAAARTNADTVLQNNIDAEATTRVNADNTLQGNVDAETTARTNADTVLQNNIDAEATTRVNADNTLQGNVDAEAVDRVNADKTLQDHIDAEAAARTNADAALDSRLSSAEKNTHFHINKDILDEITAYDIENWNSVNSEVLSDYELYVQKAFWGFATEFYNLYAAIGICVYNGGFFGSKQSDPCLDGGEFNYKVFTGFDCGGFSAITAVIEAAWIVQNSAARFVSDLEKSIWNDKYTQSEVDDKISALKIKASYSADGMMSQEDRFKLDGIASGAEVNIQSDWNMNDTGSDAYIKNKPAIPAKVSELANDIGFITSADVDTSQNHMHSNKAVLDTITQSLIDSKVDKVSGKGLSANDYTAAEKDKLAGIESGAQVNPVMSGTCSTVHGNTAKIVNCPGFKLTNGARVAVTFVNGNSAQYMTLNVNNTGAYFAWFPIGSFRSYNNALISKLLIGGCAYEFIYQSGSPSRWVYCGATNIPADGSVTKARLDSSLQNELNGKLSASSSIDGGTF